MMSLQIASYETMSTVDWPGEICSTIFCQGCPWKCNYCFNKDIINPRVAGKIPFQNVIDHLNKRKGILTGVVFSGGDALLQGQETIKAMSIIKDMGFKIGLHCDGAYPATLLKTLPLLDWVGLDIKALPQDYTEVTARGNSGVKAYKSLNILLDSDVDFEVRTTVYKGSIQSQTLYPLANLLASKGVKEWHIQNAQGDQFKDTPDWRVYLEGVRGVVSQLFDKFTIRY